MAIIMLEIDDKNLKAGFEDFPKANAIAVKNSLNTAAFLTRRNSIKNINDKFILRNTFTARNIQVEKAEGSDISKMEARAGATQRASYMRNQEEGGARTKKGATTSIPQKAARLGGSRAKIVKRQTYITRIRPKIVRGPSQKSGGSNKSRYVAKMFVAKQRNLFVKYGSNIFRVESVSSRRNRVRAKLKLLYTIEKKTIRLQKEKWLEPATKKPAQDIFAIYKSNLKKLWRSGDL